jgi:hypothetical protein
MSHRVRAGLANEEFRKLIGFVEVDETFIGGKDHNRHLDTRSHKSGGQGDPLKFAVIRAVERKGNVVARVLDRVNRATMQSFVREVVSKPRLRRGIALKRRRPGQAAARLEPLTFTGAACAAPFSLRCRSSAIALVRGLFVPAEAVKHSLCALVFFRLRQIALAVVRTRLPHAGELVAERLEAVDHGQP